MTIEFAQSERSTIGLEWELQLVDQDSDDLRQCADTVIALTKQAHPGTPLLYGEMLRNTVELVSRKNHKVSQCAADMEEGLAQLEPVLSQLRIGLASAGSHPFAQPSYQRVSDSERYGELVNRTQYWGRQMLLFGTHVHVGIEDRDKVMPISNFLATKLGHIQAVSASSPFWAGVDTGYCDNRAMVFQQLPTAGAPRQFEDWAGLEKYTSDMLKTGVIDSFDEIRWDIRPSPKLGTIEVRVCDAASNVAELRAFAALIHCLVETASRELDAGHALPTVPAWYLAENKWRASRYGMDAILIENAEGEEALITDTLPDLLDWLEPAARDLDCLDDLGFIHDIVSMGVGYQRQLQVAKETGNLEAVVAYLRAELKAGHPIRPHEFEPHLDGVHIPFEGNRGWNR